MMRLGAVTAAIAAFACTAAHAEAIQLEVAGAGEVAAQDMGDAKLLPGNLAGVTSVTTPVLIHPGYQIDGAYCRQFGFSFRATNLDAAQTVPVTVRVTHPRWTLPDGRTGTQETWTSVLQGHNWGYVGYSFTEPWSLEAGEWVFTISQDGRLLTEQKFQLDVEPGQTMPTQGCAVAVS